MRLVPILGLLAMLALLPGALAHHCFPEESQDQGSEFTVQGSTPPSSSPVLMISLIVIPFAVVGAVAAAIVGSRKAAPRTGRWVYTPTSWVWLPDRK